MEFDPTPLDDVLRKRALINEGSVPYGFFSMLCELARDLYYWERFLNASLDNKAQIEISVGKLWSSYARTVLHMPDQERRKYAHITPNGYIAQAWAYPLCYLQDFREWLREVYLPEKFPAYQQYRAKRNSA